MKALGRRLMKNSKTRQKRNKLVNNIRGIVTYLKTDSYLYSHVITSPLSQHHVHKSGLRYDKNEGILRHNERELKEKLMKYLKSDTYMYAPLEDVGHRDQVLVKNVISSPRDELEFTRVTRTVISKKIALQTKRGADNPIGDKQGEVSKGGRHDVGVASPPTPEIPQGRKQATPLYYDSVRMMKNMRNVMQ
ncbi:uncharacterized protein LOC141592452 isoform X2 [Silene latifolia]|uniref:uncharacterized protein LOC141592452 isoform X2 n=1 Tax=Silene latifolia TaxID=37657 RepID=UPI003D76BF24